MRPWLRRTLRIFVTVLLVAGGLMLWNLRSPEVAEPGEFQRSPPAETSAAIRMRVVTWNVWGLRWITPRRAERLEIVARETAKLKPDIVGFQEAFVEADRQALITSLRAEGLEHARYFHSGLVGSGLLTVSRYPIESVGFIRYVSNGRPEAFHHGDWWAGKGLSLCTLELPGGVRLYLGNTHLHARYKQNRYHETQLAQAGQLLPWVGKVLATGSPSLWLGDWNNSPDSDVLAPLIKAGQWKLLSAEKPRIDHVFGGGEGAGWEWRVLGQGKVNGKLESDANVPWSDHAAVWVDVELRRVGD